MAQKEGLVAGSSGNQTSTARLEHQPGFAGEPGITAAAGAGLRNALSGPRPGDSPRRFIPQKPATEQNRSAISIRSKAGNFSNPGGAIAVRSRRVSWVKPLERFCLGQSLSGWQE